MGAAVAVPEADRPSLVEIVSILLICAAVLVGLGVVDDRAAHRESARASAVLQEGAERAGQRASREAMTAPAARTDGLGRDSPPIGLPAASFSAPAAAKARRAAEPEPARAAVARRSTGARGGPGPVMLLLLMAGAGLSMAGAGLLLSRRSA